MALAIHFDGPHYQRIHNGPDEQPLEGNFFHKKFFYDQDMNDIQIWNIQDSNTMANFGQLPHN